MVVEPLQDGSVADEEEMSDLDDIIAPQANDNNILAAAQEPVDAENPA